jgi:hypothetical protein
MQAAQQGTCSSSDSSSNDAGSCKETTDMQQLLRAATAPAGTMSRQLQLQAVNLHPGVGGAACG